MKIPKEYSIFIQKSSSSIFDLQQNSLRMSRPLLRETIGYRPMMAAAQGLPTRRRSFWALTTSLMAGNGPSETTVPTGGPRARSGTHPAVREIHKNAWLKRHMSTDKKGTPFSRKGERFWVVFCVHDDVEAFLEFYSEPKMGTIHKPISAISLNSCLHVSPSIMGQDNEYQFVVTLQTEVIRLVAANWDQMIEWVESLQGKLREMNILSPKDNLYSKLPETRPATSVCSTRDPNSPLPPTPSALVAASQRLQLQLNRPEAASTIVNGDASNVSRAESNGRDESNSISSRLSVNGSGSNNLPPEREVRPVRCNNETSGSTSTSMQSTSTSCSTSSAETHPEITPQPQLTVKPQINVKVSVDVNNVHRTSSGNIIQNQQRHLFTSPVASASTTVLVIENGDVRIHNGSGDGQESRKNCAAAITVNCSSNNSNATPEQQLVSVPRQTNTPNTDNSSADETNLLDACLPTNPCVSRVCVNYIKVQSNGKTISKARQVFPSQDGDGTSNRDSDNATGSKVGVNKAARNPTVKSTSSDNIYEHIYIPDRQNERNGVKHQAPSSTNNGNNVKLRSQALTETDGRNRVQRSSSQRSPDEDHHPSVSSGRDSHVRRILKSTTSGSSQRSSSLGRIEPPPVSNRQREPREQEAARRNVNRSRQVPDVQGTRSVGNSTFFENNGVPHQLQGNPIDALIGTRGGDYRLRREDCNGRVSSGNNTGENDNQSNGVGSGLGNGESYEYCAPQSNEPPVPLKEQQVIHLQMEINHPGGVRVMLRKKDCLNSIAFVDYLGAVWVAGWKQTQYPVLYYAFHVGDQILKVAGVTVHSSVEASRAIKMVSSMQVEFIIRRLPYGKVFALKRSREGEPLGLVAEGGSGEISEVLPDGLAARYGLPSRGLSVECQTPCNWYLTEVNNRPLSLMSKENEVKDRLNAVGKEISILVQPADLVKHLRKSLKSYKGFKDYVVG